MWTIFDTATEILPQSASEANLTYSPSLSPVSSFASSRRAVPASVSLSPILPAEEHVAYVIREELERKTPPASPSASRRVHREKAPPRPQVGFSDFVGFCKATIDEFQKKAINSLIKRLRSHPAMLDNLRLALINQSPDTPCVAFPRTRDGRMQIGARKCVPEETYFRLFRFPGAILKRYELKPLEVCDCNKTTMVCVNPYHYELPNETAEGAAPPKKRRYVSKANINSPDATECKPPEARPALEEGGFVTLNELTQTSFVANGNEQESQLMQYPYFQYQDPYYNRYMMIPADPPCVAEAIEEEVAECQEELLADSCIDDFLYGQWQDHRSTYEGA
ncbi:hypothetical protein QR680_018134 [Steinernema hermaphroditum]|uniref:MH1 domain-containing protein n=1 Tax=Steinernema hermaphroditum TaxID=289476 RepID=A0AA39LQI6_9BILA|nr:hypothetical protein QR680_018134 [Steinernema hermaphroditum]